jgi:crossover junction endodeoxyribonuclease RusA
VTCPRCGWLDAEGVRFVVDGEPVPKKRARVGSRGGRTPAATVAYERDIGWSYRTVAPGAGLFVPVGVGIHVFEGERQEQRTGDLDNYAKTILDGLNGIAWRDDRQVARLYADIERGAEAPRVEVSIVGL